MKYICNNCGLEHEDWPALVYPSPSNYMDLSEEEKQNIASLDSDFCIINYSDQTDRFIRCTLTQKIIGHCETLEYGLWVSLSEKNFQDYSDNFKNQNHKVEYFGWLCNHLPDYEDFTVGIPTTVFTKIGDDRPEIVPHQTFDHQFVKDYYNGITIAEAEKRITEMLERIEKRNNVPINKAKPWWKVW